MGVPAVETGALHVVFEARVVVVLIGLANPEKVRSLE